MALVSAVSVCVCSFVNAITFQLFDVSRGNLQDVTLTLSSDRFENSCVSTHLQIYSLVLFYGLTLVLGLASPLDIPKSAT